jgi:hypothetical protein
MDTLDHERTLVAYLLPDADRFPNEELQVFALCPVIVYCNSKAMLVVNRCI